MLIMFVIGKKYKYYFNIIYKIENMIIFIYTKTNISATVYLHLKSQIG